VRNTLEDEALDPAFIAEAVLLPSEAFIGDQMPVVDPEAIRAAREALRGRARPRARAAVARRLCRDRRQPLRIFPAAKGARRLRTVALGYLMAAGARGRAGAGDAQFDEADNMTDRQGALGALANSDAPERSGARRLLRPLPRRCPGARQMVHGPGALDPRRHARGGRGAGRHPDFTLANPNRLRSLVGAFAANQRAFHDPRARLPLPRRHDPRVDKLNPQTAAKLVPPLGRWRRFDEAAADLMKAELERIVATPGLSKDVFEQASKSLGSTQPPTQAATSRRPGWRPG
jgi:aminopeptidase N